MLKKLMIGAALGALAWSSALAQTPPPPPAADPPVSQAAPNRTTDSNRVVSAQQSDQWLASKFRGTDVLGQDDSKIGSISDILFDKTGKIDAFVVSVGGFLGMGAKTVALAPAAFDVVPGSNGAADKLKLSMSVEELKQAQNFEPYQPPRTTTGMGPGSLPGGLTGGRRSSPDTPASGR